jgi:hypothetical protein
MITGIERFKEKVNLSKIFNPAQFLETQLANSIGEPFKEILPKSMLEEILATEGIKYYNRLFTPIVTLWTFLIQVIEPDSSCHQAVSKLVTWLRIEGDEKTSTNTSAYCQARKRLSENFLKKVFKKVGYELSKSGEEGELWCGRKVKLFDGTTVSMPDTPPNQEAYPQPSSQKTGCGFPLAKQGVLFCLQTGAVLATVIEGFRTHDVKLARQLYEDLEEGDVFVSDRACCSYADFYFLQQRKCDAVIRLHKSRKQQMKKGKRIGANDQLVTWYKPKTKPQGISKEEYNALPKQMIVREIHYYICIPGWRTKEVTVVTTLLDDQTYPHLAIVRLYERRWEVELYIRHLKTTLKLDILRGKTPDMVRKEIWVHLLAYNLLRTIMWQAGEKFSVDSLRLSLSEARHHFLNFLPEFRTASVLGREPFYQQMLSMVATAFKKKRVGRFEPRVIKRRKKSYPLMTEPREVLRQKVA